MYICIYIHICIYIYICISLSICTYIYIYIYTHIRATYTHNPPRGLAPREPLCLRGHSRAAGPKSLKSRNYNYV